MKQLFKRNVFLYKLWFFLIRNNRGIRVPFFNSSTQLYVDGYPRSGNTFLVYLIRETYPPIKMVHYLHVIASLKIPLAKKIPTYIIVRDPYESISSNYLKRYAYRKQPNGLIEHLLDDLISEYFDYYTFVIGKINEIKIVPFRKLIDSAQLPAIMPELNKTFAAGFSDQEIYSKFLSAKSSFQGATDPLGASLPTPEKEARKIILKNYLRNSAKMKEAVKCFEKLSM